MLSNLWRYFLKVGVIVAFIVTLAIALIYANGYSYDFVGQGLRKTGGVHLRYEDKMASVYLDGKKLEGTLPFVASNILPGKYNLVITREGFNNWQREIKVQPDLVQIISDIVLFPMNTDSLSKSLLELPQDGSRYFLKGNYFFAVKGKNLSYSHLTSDLIPAQLIKVTMPAEGIKQMEIWNNNAGIIKFENGDRYSFNLSSGDFQKINLGENYTATDNYWLVRQGSTISILDKNLTRVIWAGDLKRMISDVKYKEIGSRKFVFVKLSGNLDWDLYEYKNNSLKKLISGVSDGPWDIGNNTLLVNKSGNELWKLTALENSMWQRYSSEIKVMGFFADTNSLVVRLDGKVGLIDLNFSNFQEILPGVELKDLTWDQNDNFYYLKTTPDKAGVIILNYLNWKI